MEALSLLRKNMNQDPVQQSVMNKKVSLPPNQIITKEYAPDIKPMVKLITKQQLQKSEKNISYIPPKLKNEDFEKYGQQFHIADFLGYHYAQQLDQMVYFRYNNEEFNQLLEKGSQKPTRYFAGLFIPLKALCSRQFKVEDNIYNALNLQAPEIKDNISQSFSKNCKGCSFDPLFSSNYTSGNLMAAIRKKPFQYDLILQNDTNCKAAEWFNFAVKFIEQGTYKFNIVNLTHQNPMYEHGMKIACYSFLQQSLKTDVSDLIKSGHGWSFGGKNVKHLKSEIRKQTQIYDQTYYSLSFEFKCKNRHETVIFANSIPYTNIDYEKFLNRVIYNKIGQHMKMQRIDICETVGGSKLPIYIFYHRKAKSSTLLLKNISQQKVVQNVRVKERQNTLNPQISSASLINTSINCQIQSSSQSAKSIVFLARQHPGSTSSSFVLEGIVEFLMDNTQFDVFKKNFQFVVIPFVNVDGVKYGNHRVNLTGVDLNKVWKDPDEVFEPEVFHIKKFLRKLNQSHPISLIINLDSSCDSLSSYFVSSTQKKQCEQVPELFPYLASKRISQISFQKSQFLPNQKVSLINSLSQIFPKTLIYEFFTSCYGWKAESNGIRRYTESSCTSQQENGVNEFNPQIYRYVGRQLITTYLEYVRLCEKNIAIKQKWLRQIEQLPCSPRSLSKDINIYRKKYEDSWNRQLIRFDYSLYLPQVYELKNQKSEGRKHKTTLQYRSSGTQLSEVRSRQKKLTMPSVRQNRYSKQQGIAQNKENAEKSPPSIKLPSQKIGFSEKTPMNPLANQLRKSPSSSSIFTPKRRSKVLKQISETIKQSSIQQQNSLIGQQNSSPSSNLQKIIDRKEKKLSQILLDRNNQSLVNNPIAFVHKNPNNFSTNVGNDKKDKIKDAIVKFESMKRFISAMGIKAESSPGQKL